MHLNTLRLFVEETRSSDEAEAQKRLTSSRSGNCFDDPAILDGAKELWRNDPGGFYRDLVKTRTREKFIS